MDNLHEDVFTFVTICRWILLRMKNVSNKRCGGNQNTHYMFNNFFLRKLCCLWGSVEKCCGTRGQQVTIWGRVTCSITKDTRVKTHERACAITPTHAHTCTHSVTWHTPLTHTHTHTQRYMYSYFVFHYNNGFVNVPHCNVIRINNDLEAKSNLSKNAV